MSEMHGVIKTEAITKTEYDEREAALQAFLEDQAREYALKAPEREAQQIQTASFIAALRARRADTEWIIRAKCRGINPDVFFPTDGMGVIYTQNICRECPVKAACLDYALTNKIDHGVWGGVSERERRRILRDRRARAKLQLQSEV